MRISTLIALLYETQKCVGDEEIRYLTDGKSFINIKEYHRSESYVAIDPAHDSQKGVSLCFSNGYSESGNVSEAVSICWDILIENDHDLAMYSKELDRLADLDDKMTQSDRARLEYIALAIERYETQKYGEIK